MKKYDDKFLKESLKKDTSEYKIKTTSEDILAAYEKEKISKTQENSSHKNYFFSSRFFKIAAPIACSVILLSAILPISIYSIYQGGQNEPPVPPTPKEYGVSSLSSEYQEVIGKQLNTLISFGMNPLSTSISSENKDKIVGNKIMSTSSISPFDSDDDDDNDHNETDISFSYVIDLYDPYAIGVRNLILNPQYIIKDDEQDNDFYNYFLTFTSGEQVMNIEYSMYYQEDIDEFVLEGNLITNVASYPITIKTETEQDEKEIETIIEFSENNVVLIEEESEFEGHETENSLSYAIFASKEDLERDEDSFIKKFSFESETEDSYQDMEAEIQTQNEADELQLENIHMVNENEFTFTCEYESEDKGEFNGLIRNIFNIDGSRTYINDETGEEITKK